jgi:hypothetical protein
MEAYPTATLRRYWISLESCARLRLISCACSSQVDRRFQERRSRLLVRRQQRCDLLSQCGVPSHTRSKNDGRSAGSRAIASANNVLARCYCSRFIVGRSQGGNQRLSALRTRRLALGSPSSLRNRKNNQPRASAEPSAVFREPRTGFARAEYRQPIPTAEYLTPDSRILNAQRSTTNSATQDRVEGRTAYDPR